MSRLGRYLSGLKPVGLIAGGIMWIVWLISIALGTGNLDRTGQVVGADHAAFHTAAQFIDEGRGAELFDFPTVRAFAIRQQEITGKADFVNPFRNPPFYGYVYIPTSRLQYLSSYAIWAVIGALSLAGGLALICGRKFLWAMFWSLSFYPVFAAISFGQNSLLSVGILGLVFHCLTRGRLFWAGLAAGLLVYKPQLLLGLGVWWLLGIRQYWSSLAGLTCAFLTFAGISWITMPDLTIAYVQKFPEMARYDAFEFYNLHNPRGFGALITGNKSVGNWFVFFGLALTLLWLVCFWRRHSQDRSLMFAAAVIATLFGSPHTMIYEWSLAVVAACVLWRARPSQRQEWFALFALAWIALFVSTPLTKLQLDTTGLAVQCSVPVLAFVVWRVDRSLRADEIQCGT